MPDRDAESDPAGILMSFLNAAADSTRARVLKAHPELLSQNVDEWLAKIAAMARTEDPVWAETVERGRGYLAHFRSGGQQEPLPADAVTPAIPDQLASAWKALTRGDNSGMAELISRYPELVGQQFGDLLRHTLGEAREAGNYVFAAWLRGRLDAFDSYRIRFAATMLEATEDVRVGGVLLEGIESLVAAPDWHACGPVITGTPQLLGDRADLLCRTLLGVARALGDEEVVSTYYANWMFLRNCRSHGLADGIAAFTDWAGTVSDQVAASYARTEDAVMSALRSSDPLASRAALADVEGLLSRPGAGTGPRAFVAKMLINHGLLLLRIAELTKDSNPTEAAIRQLESAHKYLPGNAPEQLGCLTNLGSALRFRFRRTGDLDDLRRAANCLVSAAELGTPFSSNREQIMALVREVLTDLAWLVGETEPLDQLIDLQREDLRYSGPVLAEEAEHALAVGYSLERRYQLTGEEASLVAMIDILAETADKVGQVPQLAELLDRAGFGLIQKYGNSGNPADLDRSLVLLQAAVAAAEPGSVALSASLDHWGCALRDRYARHGDRADLDLAIELAEQAFENAPDLPGKGAFAPTNLANCLMDRYSAIGDERVLNRAIELYEQAASIPAGREENQRLSGLAVGLMIRHYRTGDLTDLDAAARLFRQVLDGLPARSSDRLMALTDLGLVLRDRYERMGDPADLDQAVDLFERVVADDPSSAVLRASHLGNLALGFFTRWHSATARPDDLEAAIRTWEKAVALTEAGSPLHNRLVANLGGALTQREEGRGKASQPGDATRAIGMLTLVVDAAERGTPNWVAAMSNLATAFRIRSQEPSSSDDLSQAIEAYRLACTVGLDTAPGWILQLGQNWAAWAVSRQSWAEANQAASYGLAAMHRLYRAQLRRGEKEIWLREAVGISSLAAYAATATGDLRGAVAAFEGGRALILSEILELDAANVTSLAASGRDSLAGRYRSAADRWHELSQRRERLDRDTADPFS